MAPTWLKQRREGFEGLTQEALAAALEMDKRKLAALERCETGAPKEPPYERLAELLDVSVTELADAHAHDLDALGQPERAAHARRAAAAAWRRERFNQVDSAALERALGACAGTPLIQGMAGRPPNLPDAPAQATHIARLLAEDRMDDLFNLTVIPLREAIAAAVDARQLDALRGFLTEVAKQSAAEDKRLQTGGEWHRLPEDTPAWVIRALIDRSCGLDGMRLVRPAAEEHGDCIDDGPDSTRALRSGPVTQALADARLRELVFGFGGLLPTVKRRKPAPGDAEGFATYAQVVNRQLRLHNGDHDHVFGLWSQATMEAREVKDALLALLPNLRLFALETGLGERALLRVDRDGLETWLAAHFRLLLERRRQLAAIPTSKPQPTTNTEPAPMRDAHTQQPVINVHGNVGSLSTGDHSPATQANDQATIHQLNASQINQQLQDALADLLACTDPRDAAQLPLRKAVIDMQGELAETGRVSDAGREGFRLAQAKEGLSLTEQALSIAANVSGLLGLAGIAA